MKNMQNNIRIRNRAEVCTIDIEGTIGVPEAWQFDDPAQRVATYDAFRDAVRRIGAVDAAEVVVNIRSTGGDVNDALLIYDALAALPARITTRCYGYTASAATLVAQAASEGRREISANALYLIHNAVCATEGNAEELSARLDLLRQTDRRIAALYAARAGRPEAEFAALMAQNNGTGRWLAPAEAVAAGLADTVIGDATSEETAAEERPETEARPQGAENLRSAFRKSAAPDSLIGGLLRRRRTKGPRTGAAAAPDGGAPADACNPTGRTAARLPDPTEDRNILHFDDDPELRPAQSLLAAREGQEGVGPTKVAPREDPSVRETLPTANERAYTGDARRFSKF